MTQDQVFRQSEADAYFARNPGHPVDGSPLADAVARVVSAGAAPPRRILEVGCSSGQYLGHLCAVYGAAGVGIEPSPKAVAAAASRFPGIDFRIGIAADPPLAAGEVFDLVVVNFVLHWIDRATLLASAAAIDRAVADDGLLAVGDFAPNAPKMNPYRHCPDESLFTYKQDYERIFEAANLYRPLYRAVYAHGRRPAGMIANDDRCAVTVLRKSLTGYYRND